jgi:hypothetical protein
MTLTCAKCRRTNPAEAIFCYFDGQLLPGSGRANGGPLNAGAMRFAREFVFPSGRRCHSFDELSVACVQERPAAADLLQQGYLESFLGGIGRADLALMARQAAKFPDRLRGLDMLVERFPSRVVSPPKLHVEPQSVNLGLLAVGEDRRCSLHIANQGMRLLYGSVAVDKAPWLALSDEALPEKSFDCEDELEIPVLVRGKKLKAAGKPQEARLLVESNGGTAELIVRVEVPVLPFPAGILAGVTTQRQLAEQAFKNPKEASPLFENGDVARWYTANGWQYPVQGPTATGIAALQQFLEACGLTQAPRLEINTKAIELRGDAGDRREHAIHIKTADRKPVFAYAVSDKDWLVPRKAVLSGTSATLTVDVPSIPYGVDDKPLTARLTLVGNGRQKFIIPVTLHVTGGLRIGDDDIGAAAVPLDQSVESFMQRDDGSGPITRRQQPVPLLTHLMPAALLLLVLLGIVLLDLRRGPGIARPDLPDEEPARGLDNTPWLKIEFSNQEHHRFGLRIDHGEEKDKKLTFQPDGRTNNSCLRIDELDYIFGQPPGSPGSEHRSAPHRPIQYDANGYRTTWEYVGGDIQVMQDVSLRRTDQTEKLQTCLVRYMLKNKGKDPHRIGLRFMLDTFIGQNDGVPFTVPGKGLCDTQLEFKAAAEIPDFIQALEKPDLENTGTVAHLTLKAGRLEPPSRLLLTGWPDPQMQQRGQAEALGPATRWDVPLISMKELRPNDSAVVMYWEEKELRPGQQRELGFAYGLGQVSAAASPGGRAAKMALTADGSFRPGGVFSITAYVSRPELDQLAKIELPDGLQLVEEAAERRVPPIAGQTYSPVTWKVRADRVGTHEITVRSGDATQTQRVKIVRKSFLE